MHMNTDQHLCLLRVMRQRMWRTLSQGIGQPTTNLSGNPLCHGCVSCMDRSKIFSSTESRSHHATILHQMARSSLRFTKETWHWRINQHIEGDGVVWDVLLQKEWPLTRIPAGELDRTCFRELQEMCGPSPLEHIRQHANHVRMNATCFKLSSRQGVLPPRVLVSASHTSAFQLACH